MKNIDDSVLQKLYLKDTVSQKPLDAFLHPRRATRVIQEGQEEISRLSELADTLSSQLAEARAHAEKTAEELTLSQQSQQELMRLLMDTRTSLGSEIEFMKRQLEEARIEEQTLREIDSQIERMKISQQRYRQRIADLKSDLASARQEVARLARRPSSGIVGAISMDASAEAPSPPVADKDADWLLPLP